MEPGSLLSGIYYLVEACFACFGQLWTPRCGFLGEQGEEAALSQDSLSCLSGVWSFLDLPSGPAFHTN